MIDKGTKGLMLQSHPRETKVIAAFKKEDRLLFFKPHNKTKPPKYVFGSDLLLLIFYSFLIFF